MRLRIDEPDYSGFDEAAAQLGDTDLADRLTRLFKQLDQGSVVIFNGGWGVGKTTFIRRWMAQLNGNSIPCVYLDAFSVDHLEAPFVAVAGAITEAVQSAHKEHDPKFTSFLRSAGKVGRSLAATTAKIGLRAATLGAVSVADLDELGTLPDAASTALADFAEESVKRLIEEHSARHKEVASLRAALAELPSLISGGAEDKPLVVVIDELDRCRPDFALGLLEVLKHFFRAPRTHFILVSNRAQIEQSITHRYGSGVNAVEYLRKFFDFQIDYEIDYTDKHGSRIDLFLNRLHSQLLSGVPDGRYIRDYFRDMARAYNLSLRDLENIYTNLALAYAVLDNRYRPAILVSVLALLKVIAPAVYAKAKVGSLSFEELERVAFANRDWGDFDIDHLRKIFRWHLDPHINPNDPDWSGYQEPFRYNLGRLDTIKFLANGIVDRFEPPPETTSDRTSA